MKIVPSLALSLSVAISILSVSLNTFGQQFRNVNHTSSAEVTTKINGNSLIENLLTQRDAFTKSLNKSNEVVALPQAQYIFDRDQQTTITFNGLDFVIRDNEVLAIKGLNLSKEVLTQITEKLVFLDRVQFYYAQKSNLTYLNPNADVQEVKFLDKQFISSLKIFNTTVKDIAALAKTENPSFSVETNISKMRQPNIDKAIEKQTLQSLVQLAK
ncbi:hypothetical protein EA772_20475 [Pedobacter sp. G11]|uniref:hypothetical protein n=1 Tax=Pedobacter sp. G11 TaxID=2482728 RepID=UPI000F5D8A80|nr:hypothetical protein [Pedobacter sp. G11]AZI27602.1 hypothetical protein EA772_20475 [Pedobacter sp. G11]